MNINTDPGLTRIYFGKYYGNLLQDIPSSYLKWLAENCDNDEIATNADLEWQYREKYGKHFNHEELIK